jgi:hypothetical protein
MSVVIRRMFSFSLENEAGEENNNDENKSDNEAEAAEEEVREEVPLTDDIIGQSLSLLAKTGNGLAHAYTRLEVSNR